MTMGGLDCEEDSEGTLEWSSLTIWFCCVAKVRCDISQDPTRWEALFVVLVSIPSDLVFEYESAIRKAQGTQFFFF
jgi:hypothetical protein